MESKAQLTVNQSVKFIFTSLILIFSSNLFAQVAPDAAQTMNSSATEEGMTQTEIVSYIAMIVGFAVIVALAWFTSIRAKKRNEEANHHAIAGGHRYHHGHHPHPYDPYRKTRKRSR